MFIFWLDKSVGFAVKYYLKSVRQGSSDVEEIQFDER